MNKIVSLVVTAHRKCFLYESLMSVAAQTDKDFEFILCLDIKKDKTLVEFCKPIFDLINCSSKKIVTICGNGTAGYSRNYAFSNTTTNWISYLDGDDMIMPNAIEIMKKYIEQYPDIQIFSSAMLRINKEGNLFNFDKSIDYYPPIKIYEVDPEVVGEPTFFNQFQIMKRQVWEEYKYDESTNGEDIDFMLINLLKWKFLKVPEFLYCYRDVDNSFSKETYKQGDFTTQRYLSGFYKEYFQNYYSEKVAGNFKKL